MYFVYIVSCKDASLYTGCTNDLENRLKMHNLGKGARYTASRKPVELVYSESQPDKSTALKREIAIKKMSRKEKIELIEKGQK